VTRPNRVIDWLAERPLTISLLWMLALGLLVGVLVRWPR
jgi:hypothetical protein